MIDIKVVTELRTIHVPVSAQWTISAAEARFIRRLAARAQLSHDMGHDFDYHTLARLHNELEAFGDDPSGDIQALLFRDQEDEAK